MASQTFSQDKVARKRDPPIALSTGRDALLRVRSGNWLVRQRLEGSGKLPLHNLSVPPSSAPSVFRAASPAKKARVFVRARLKAAPPKSGYVIS